MAATDASKGAIYPVEVEAVGGESEGNKFLSVIGKVKDKIDTSVEKIERPFEEWAYNRGVGKIPSVCPAGYSSSSSLLCAQDCPSGYSSVAGVCWQQCPPGYSDTGAFCTLWKWWPHTITKKSWVQKRIGKHCPSGQVNEAGLCYEPCADTFNGVGPMCFGRFGAGMASRIRNQAGDQHAQALANAGQGGIVVPEGQTPTLKTDMSFAPIVCGLDAIEGFAGVPIPDAANLGGLGVDAAGGAVIGAISDQIKDENQAWFVPTLSDTVLFDFSAELSCEDDGTVATAGLMMKPSITVKASTRSFDPALHALAGVDLGIMTVSVYELIPFRVYGTVGSTLSAQTTLESVVDREQPPVIIDGIQHANSTNLEVIPRMELWLSSTAYVRITSILNFIPDLLQIGAEFKLWVMDLAMPYTVEEGVREASEGGYETYKTESLERELSSGNGYVNTFLKVLGIDINAFGDEADIHCTGIEDNAVEFVREESQAIAQ
jgi:hypothetical protein